MSYRLLVVVLALPRFLYAVDLPRNHSCLMQAHAATGRPSNSYAFILKSGDVAYLANADKVLQVLSPKASNLPGGDANLVSPTGYKSYVGINDESVTAYTGSKNNVPEIQFKVADKIEDSTMADMIREDIMNALKRSGVDISSAKARIFSACRNVPLLNLPSDWEKKSSPSGKDGSAGKGGVLEDLWGDGESHGSR